MAQNCAQIEERLSDYLEGTLEGEERRDFESHLGGCRPCALLVAQVASVLKGVHALKPLEVPHGLVSRILGATTAPKPKRKPLTGRFAWLEPFWKPRLAMGAAMVLATLLIVMQLATPAKIKKLSVLNPVDVYRHADRQAHLLYARSAKFVSDLRVVYEIQSRLRPESAPAPGQRDTHPQTPQQKSQDHDHSENGNTPMLALITPGCGEQGWE